MRVDLLARCATCGADVQHAAHYCANCGYGQPSRVPGNPGEPVDLVDRRVTPPLLPTRPSQTGLLVTAGIVALLLSLTVPILVVRAVFFGPDDIVHDYFSALAARDADKVWATLDAGQVSRSEPLLSDQALTAPGYAPPTNVVLTKLDEDGEDATAHVTYTVDGETTVGILSLHQGRATNLLQRWHITDGTQPVSVQPPAASFQLGGVTINLGEPGQLQLEGFLGRYTLALPSDPLLSADPVPVRAGAQQMAALAVRVSPTAETAIGKKVHEYVDGCAKSTQIAPPNCPFSASSYYAEPVHWQVVSYPTLTLVVGEGGQVVVSTQNSGTVRVTGAPGSYSSPDTGSFSVRGTATASGGTIEFVPSQ